LGWQDPINDAESDCFSHFLAYVQSLNIAYNNNNNNNNNNSMWNVKTKVIPVTIGATGTISKSFSKYASNIPAKHEVKEQQETAIFGTAHILRKVLM
jgi:hypothetical protein